MTASPSAQKPSKPAALVGLLVKQLGATVTAGPNSATIDGGTVFTVEWRQAACGP